MGRRRADRVRPLKTVDDPRRQIVRQRDPDHRRHPLIQHRPQEERHADICGWYLRLREDCQTVVRVTATDPLLGGEAGGDAGEELEFLARHGFAVEVLPGVLAETVYESRAAVREATATVHESGRALAK